MQSNQPSSEIILRSNGSIYHLGLRPEHLCELIFVVGDPERVPAVSQYFDKVETKVSKREFVTHVGTLLGRRVMVCSSGIGTDNVEILLTELHILANYDLKSLEPLPNHKSLKIIRIGTSGALQPDLPVDSLLISDYAFGLDALLQFYNLEQESHYLDYAQELMEECELDFLPYCDQADQALKDQFSKEMMIGNTVTAPGFYAPQGRKISLSIRPDGFMEKLQQFEFDGGMITNFEMETSAYYTLGKALGHKVLSTNAIMANRALNQFTTQGNRLVDRLIQRVLEKTKDL